MATRDQGSGNVEPDPSKSTAGASTSETASGGSSTNGPGSSDAGAGHQIREETRRLKQQATEKARSYADERKQKAADQVGGMAQALRSAADSLQSQDQRYIADYIGRAAEGLDRMSGALRQRDIGALARQAQDIARQQPTLLIGGAMVAGFLAARFAKASGARQDGSRDGRRLAEGMSQSGATGRSADWRSSGPSQGGPH